MDRPDEAVHQLAGQFARSPSLVAVALVGPAMGGSIYGPIRACDFEAATIIQSEGLFVARPVRPLSAVLRGTEAMRPPEEFEGKPSYHWVRRSDGFHGDPMAWVSGLWWQIGIHTSTSPEQASELGWVWLGVAEPPENGWETRG